MNYQDYIKSELLILIPVLYLLGVGLKKSLIPDKWIPCLLGIAEITLSATWVLSTCKISTLQELTYAVFVAITQGILIAGSAVYINQIYKQGKKKNSSVFI